MFVVGDRVFIKSNAKDKSKGTILHIEKMSLGDMDLEIKWDAAYHKRLRRTFGRYADWNGIQWISHWEVQLLDMSDARWMHRIALAPNITARKAMLKEFLAQRKA